MPESVLVLIVAVVAAAVGAVLGYAARRLLAASRVKHAESYAERIITEARAKQKEIVLEGKDSVLQQQRASEDEARGKRADLQRQERLLLDRSESLDRKLEALERREAATEERLTELEAERGEIADLRRQQLAALERVSGLSVVEARESMIQQVVDEAEAEAQHRVREIERRAVEAAS